MLSTVILVFHILGAVTVLGATFATMLVLFESEIPWLYVRILQRFWWAAFVALAVLLVTGIWLAASDWPMFRSNGYFWIKIGLLIADSFVGWQIMRRHFSGILEGKEEVVSLRGHQRQLWFFSIIVLIILTIGILLANSL